MTVSTTNNRVSYAGNGVTTVFSFPNKFFANTDLVVTVVVDATGVATVKTLTTHYTVTGAGDDAGGSVTMITAPATGETLVIYRDPPLTQLVDMVNGDPFNVETGVERPLDSGVLIMQRLKDLLTRSLRLSDADTAVDMTLPAKVDRASRYSAWDADGAPMVAQAPGGPPASPFMETVLDDTTAGSAIKTIRDGLTAETSPQPDDEVTLWDAGADAGRRAQLRDVVRYEDVRQTVVTGSADTNGAPNFITIGTGLEVDLVATATPVLATFSAGEDTLGPVNYRAQLAADQTGYFSDLLDSEINFLFLDRNADTGAITPYTTIVRPQRGPVFGIKKQSQLNFTGADASTTITDEYGNTWAALGNAQINANKLLCDGTGDGAESTTLTEALDGSWTIEADVVFNALPSVGVSATIASFYNAGGFGVTLLLNNTAGTIKTSLFASSDGSTNGIANAVLGAKTAWLAATRYHVAIARDKLDNVITVHVDGVLDSTTVMISTSAICAVTTARIGIGIAGAAPLDGTLDNFRTSACCRYPNGVAFTPPSAEFVPDAEWFDTIEHKWKFGSPTSWTVKQRLHIGEVTTATGSIIALNQYAYKGRYVSPLVTIPASGVGSTFSHRLGIQDSIFRLALVCQVAEKGYSIGDVVSVETYGDAATGAITVSGTGRISASVTYLTGIPIVNKGAATFSNITPASWKYQLRAEIPQL